MLGRRILQGIADLLLPVAFLGSIGLVLARTDWQGHSDLVERLEARQPAPMPAAPRSLSQAYHYPAEFSRFLDDHYGLREAAIGLRARLGFWLLGDTFNPDVSVGQRGWLFLTGHGELRDTLHATPLAPDALETWAQSIEERRAWLAARGIRYLFVIAPDKRTIYPENLPRYQPPPGLTRREQLDARMAGQDAFLDLTEVLRDGKARGQVYYHWDTHWDRRGAYDAYRAAMRRLGLPAEPEYLGHAPDREDHAGDLGRLSGLALTEPDQVPATPCVVHVPPPAVALRADPALKGDRGFEVKPATCAEGTGRLLMFHDSFGSMWEPWLSTQFASAVYLWRQPSFEDIKRMVEAVHPTVVIEERVERFLIFPVRR
jgi:hypothetical protein